MLPPNHLPQCSGRWAKVGDFQLAPGLGGWEMGQISNAERTRKDSFSKNSESLVKSNKDSESFLEWENAFRD